MSKNEQVGRCCGQKEQSVFGKSLYYTDNVATTTMAYTGQNPAVDRQTSHGSNEGQLA